VSTGRCPGWLAALIAALLGALVSVPSWGRTSSSSTPIVVLADVSIAPAGDDQLAVTFAAFGRTFTATLEPADPYAPGARDVWVDASGSTTEEPQQLFYAGALAGNDQGWLRLAVRNGTLEGVMWTPDDIYFLEPATAMEVTADAQATIGYRLSDLGATWDTALCGASSTARCGRGASCAWVRGETLAERVASALRAPTAAGTRVALIGDYGFFERYGSGTASEMALVWHVVAGFEGSVASRRSIDTTVVHTAPGVPASVGVTPPDMRYHFAASRSASDGRRRPRACVAHTGQAVAAWARDGSMGALEVGGEPSRVAATAVPTAAPEPPTPNASLRSFGVAAAISLNTLAQAAIGQPNVLSNILNQVGPAGLYFPYDIARDPSVSQTRFYVVDAFSSRVLGFECAGTNCALPTLSAATRVFGQPDFLHHDQNGGLLGGVSANVLNFPFGAAVSATGTLFVADSGNNRVLVYQNPWSDAVADLVLGQSSMSASAPGSGLNQLHGPQGVFVDGTGALWVADTGNNRVLKFTSITTGASAALAIGGSGAASATTLSGPCDVVVDGGGNLFVADTGFNRVLRYAPPLTGGMSASIVFGHAGSMSNGTANQGGTSANSLAGPEKLAVDGGGRLWVSDTANNRVLAYDTPLTNQTATRVYGQASRSQVPVFTSGGFDAPDGFPNAAGFWGPRGIAFDGNGTLWVVDRDNSRVLGFDTPLGAAPAAIIADRALGKPDFVGSYANLPTQTRVNNPVALAVDRSHTPNRLWIADIGNNRVLGYASTANLPSDQPADRVLGQPSFTSGSTNAGINGPLQNAVTAAASASSLFFPMGVAVDSHGGVYIGDTSNSRVLHFLDPFATDTTADRVFGQGSFTTRNPSFPYGTAGSLAGLGGVSIGPADELWVADTLDHRVVRFSNAPAQPTTGATADVVLGQSGFASSSTFPAYAPGCTAARMNAPLGVFAAASNRVYVADSGNNRVLVFTPPFSNGMSASAVFGQSGFTACSPNRGGAPGAATLSNPQGAYEDDAGTVYIADAGNQRVLIYTTPFAGGDLVADAVIGQPDFTSTNVPPPRPDTLSQPAAVAGDAVGNLFVADRENSRTTRYTLGAPPTVLLDAISDPIVVGAFNGLTGTGFTAGSVVVVFVATGNGSVQMGPYTPFSSTAGSIVWFAPPQIPLGNGFATVEVVNTDQGFISSNLRPALLYGAASAGFPTITAVNGVPLNAPDSSVPLANVSTAIAQSTTITLTGMGFVNPVVALYSSNPNAAALEPLAGATSTQIQVTVPANIPTGPGALQVLNRPSLTGSNVVSIPIGEPIRLDHVSQSGTTITATGAGFSVRTIISFFNTQPGGVVNLGALVNGTQSLIPFTLVSPQQLTFQIPAGAVSGASYVQLLNPPFIPFTSTGNTPNGAINISVP
jgi:sugar lactone lactonase YvrE